MKPLIGDAGKRKEFSRRASTNESEAKYWAVGHKKGRTFLRADGTTSTDKTIGWHSRPGHKEQIRNANRAITKRARQILKRQMLVEAST